MIRFSYRVSAVLLPYRFPIVGDRFKQKDSK